MEENMLTVNEVATKLHVVAVTVRRWIINGELNAINIATGKKPEYRIREQDLKLFLLTRETKKD